MTLNARPEAGAEISVGEGVFKGAPKSLTLEEKVTELFNQLRDGLYRYLLTILHNVGEAEDTTQDAFLRLHRQLQEGESIDNVKSWLFRVGHNLALNREKTQRRFAADETETVEELLADCPDPALNPEEVLAHKELLRNLHAAISRLSSQQQQCLHLRAEGFRYREIAGILDVTDKVVSENLRRGILRLIKDFHG
jgi:RNA polymerase sigma-70 factor (ECF subfamily)